MPRLSFYKLACARVVAKRGVVVDNLSRNPFRVPTVYFLTHVHSDHMAALSAKGPPVGAVAVCGSVPTIAWLHTRWSAAALKRTGTKLVPLPLDKWATVPFMPHVRVIATEAFHCPGSIQLGLHFTGDNTKVAFSGDYRLRPRDQAQWLRAMHGCNVLCLDGSRQSISSGLEPQEQTVGRMLRFFESAQSHVVYFKCKHHGPEQLLALAQRWGKLRGWWVDVAPTFPDAAWTKGWLRSQRVPIAPPRGVGTGMGRIVLTPFVPSGVDASLVLVPAMQWSECQRNQAHTPVRDRFGYRLRYSTHADGAETRQLYDLLKPASVLTCHDPIGAAPCALRKQT